MAINGRRSNFKPNENGDYTLDNFKEMFELSANEVTSIQRWKELKAKINRTSDENQELINLTTKLASKIIMAEDWNLLLDAMYNLEQAYVDKGLNQIETTVENYVANYAKQDINNKLGTQINELLLTDATKIIIATSQPAVENGALWIKPKTTV